MQVFKFFRLAHIYDFQPTRPCKICQFRNFRNVFVQTIDKGIAVNEGIFQNDPHRIRDHPTLCSHSNNTIGSFLLRGFCKLFNGCIYWNVPLFSIQYFACILAGMFFVNDGDNVKAIGTSDKAVGSFAAVRIQIAGSDYNGIALLHNFLKSES